MSGQQEFYAPLLDPELPVPSGLRTWNGSDPAARYAVYRNNVTASLVDALAESFPVTLQLVGEEFFRAMAAIFVRQEPPRSRVLAFYGDTLPRFIEQFPPARSLAYLADMARLEMLRVQAFYAADQESLDAGKLTETLAGAGDLESVRLQLHPSVGLLRSPYAVASLWAAHQGVGDISRIKPSSPEHTLVQRVGLEVHVRRLDPASSEFVARLLGKESVGAAAEQACAISPEFDLVATLGFLVRAQGIVNITVEQAGRI